MTSSRVCIVLASDSKYFHQLQASIGSIQRWSIPVACDINVIGIDLSSENLEWLKEHSVGVHTDLSVFPLFPDAPNWYAALTGRPMLPQTFPGYEGYVWVDSDIRFLSPDGLHFFVRNSLDRTVNLAVAAENEPAYYFSLDAGKAAFHGEFVYNRYAGSYGKETADFLRYFPVHNSGLVSAHADSPIWLRWQRNIEKTMKFGPHRLFEQEAMNVAIVEVGGIKEAPTIYNWVCPFSTPERGPNGTWVSPLEPSRKISVAHLALSNNVCPYPGQKGTMYDFYKSIGLTA